MIKEIFKQYKEIDLKILSSLKENKEDVKLLEERGEIIKRIISSNVDKSEVKKIHEDMKLKDLDKEIEKNLKEKMQEVKKDIKKLATGKAATRSYAAANRSSNFFGTKI